VSHASELDASRAEKKVKTLFGWLFFRRISLPLSLLVARTPVRPSQITALGLGAGLSGAACIATGSFRLGILGGVLALLAKLLDAMDGEVARAKHLDTSRGYVVDGLCDRLRDTALVIGLGVGAYRHGSPSALAWTIAAVAGFLAFFYVSGAAPSHWREVRSHADLKDKHGFRVTDQIRLGAGDTLAVAVMIATLIGQTLWLVIAVAVVGPVAIGLKLRRILTDRPWEREATETVLMEEGLVSPITFSDPGRRVLLLGPSPQGRGGISQFSSNLASSLQDSAVVKFVSLRKIYPSLVRAGRQGPDPSANVPSFEANRILTPWLPWTWVRAASVLRKFSPDVMVVQWWHPLLAPCMRYLTRVASRSGARVVFVCHNSEPHEFFPFATGLSRMALRKADALLTLSETVAVEVRSLVPDRPVHVLSHPPNLAGGDGDVASWLERIGPVDGRIILFFGNVRRYKGLADVIAAMPLVREHVKATLVVVGNFFEPISRYRRLARRLGVEKSVRLLPGYVPNEKVAGLFRCADLVVLPYRSASQSGIVPLAAQFGIPVVATSVGGIPQALDGAGILVPPRDSAGLARGLAAALRDPPRAPALPANDWADLAAEVFAVEHAPAPAARRFRALPAILRGALWITVAFFVARVLLDGLQNLDDASFSLDAWPLVLATVLTIVARVPDVAGWHLLVRGTGTRVSLSTSSRVFTTAELVRFLPGGALHLAARYRFAAKVGIRPEVVVTTTAMDLGLRILTALMLFVALLPLFPSVPASTILVPIIGIPLVILAIHPRSIGWVVSRASRLLGRDWQPVKLSYSTLGVVALLEIVGWVIRGIGVYLIAVATVPTPSSALAAVAGVTAISWVLGVVTPFAPGGLGIREAVGASLLAPYLGLSNAVVVMLVARVLGIAVELTTTWAVVAWDVARQRHRPGGESRGGSSSGRPDADDTIETLPAGAPALSGTEAAG
jgi:glycosyltransferase involved in cell wall biosynthesis/phosphatidylglycerophosphate synthase/uncharacterized membrane protein YbhN (UPF0104 family)